MQQGKIEPDFRSTYGWQPWLGITSLPGILVSVWIDRVTYQRVSLNWCIVHSAVSICLPYITDSQVFDVKALRAFRVLRPLKLVSGVPSQYI